MSISHDERSDVHGSFLAEMLLEEITPVVMVLTTPRVEESCLKNNLSLVQMMRPFCHFENIDVPVRTSSDQPYRLQTFKIRLFEASRVAQMNSESTVEHLKKVIDKASKKAQHTLQSCQKEESTSVLDDSESRLSLFQSFNKEILHTLSFSDHEAFDHPIVCLVVVSSSDDHPISKFVDLFNTDKLPSLFNEGAMDPKILKHYLLVHDNQDGAVEKANEILVGMRSTFGPNDCQLVHINSNTSEDELQIKPWTSEELDTLSSHQIGRFLSAHDVKEMRETMLNLSSKHIIPHMEQKIRILNQQVSATRKGFRNQIKNLWWRKGKEDIPDTSAGSMYSFSSLESQIRVLGDFAFMLQDYELALSSYRLLSTDYKMDKAWRRYAGVQEMAGLCLFMLDQPRKESEYYMETAFNTYLKIGSSGQRNATRCGIWWTEILKATRQFRDAATIYVRISNEEPSLHAAVILEQASYCFLHSSPPMLRKHGFHCVLAGNRYEMCGQRELAVQAYRCAQAVYKEQPWSYINNHVHYNLGRWFALLGIYDLAVQQLLVILSCAHQSLATQKLFLGDFIRIVEELQRSGKKFDVHKLELPSIDLSSLKVSYEDHRTYGSPTAVLVKEKTWQSLEEDMVPSTSSVRTNWLDSLPKSYSVKKPVNSHVCVAGESVKVHIQFRNPLQIPIDVQGVSLLCEFTARSSLADCEMPEQTAEKNERSSNSTVYDGDEVSESDNIGNGYSLVPQVSLSEVEGSPFISMEVDFTLKGNETITVELSVIPKVEGILRINGVRWTLCGLVAGCQMFNLDPDTKAISTTKRNSIAKAPTYLKFAVLKNLPRLTGRILSVPQKIYKGEIHRLVLELSNHSESPLQNLKMSASHARFLFPGTANDLDLDIPCCFQDQSISQRHTFSANPSERLRNSLFSFPEDAIIHGHNTLLWPLWFHPSIHGKMSLHLSVFYEMGRLSDGMSFRTLRLHYDVQVLPSLDVLMQIYRDPTNFEEYLVRMDIINRSRSDAFSLHQVSVIGESFHLKPLPDHKNSNPEAESSASVRVLRKLPAAQASSQFFKLINFGKPAPAEGLNSKSSQAIGDHNTPSSQCDGVLVQVNKTPIWDFHLREKSNDENMLSQEFKQTVDFVLIAQQQHDDELLQNPLSKSSLPLSSHHICHCRLADACPVSWQMEGPTSIAHDFSKSFCDVKLHFKLQNLSEVAVSIRLNSLNKGVGEFQGDNEGNQEGWRDVSLEDGKFLSNLSAHKPSSNKLSCMSISPFVWTGLNTFSVELKPRDSAVVPLSFGIFAPGVYDLSDYELHWEIVGNSGGRVTESNSSSGTGLSQPFYLMAIQSI